MLPLKCKIKLPSKDQPGSFGHIRKYDIHTGIDLYCSIGETVYAIEDGIISNYGPFTGIGAGSDWWENTDYICIKGKSGKILYGEIDINKHLLAKTNVKKGDVLGYVKKVLRVDKGKPMTMLHIELYNEQYAGTGETWELDQIKPKYLEDITVLLNKELETKRNIHKIIYLIYLSLTSIILLTLNFYYKWI